MMDRGGRRPTARHTGSVQPEDDDETQARPRNAGSSVLAAAMLGIGRVLEPDKTEVQIEIVAPGDPDDLPLDLDFGGLPPLDDLPPLG
jgi:hypothetical protein